MNTDFEQDILINDDTDDRPHENIAEKYKVIQSEIDNRLQNDIHNSLSVQKISEFPLTTDKQKDYNIDNAKNVDFSHTYEEIHYKPDSELLIMNDVKKTLSATVSSVCEQCIIEEVKATLDNVLSEISNDTNVPKHHNNENQQIVVHVGAIEDIQRLGIKIPKVPDLKDLLVSGVDVESKPATEIIAELSPSELAEQSQVVALPLWMPQPAPQANCPFGLEFLAVIDTVRISQTKIIPGFSRPSFIVSNNIGQFIYEVDVRASCFSNFFCASRRKYEMSILNSDHTEVMHFSRPSERHGRRSLEVFAPFDMLIGKINEGRGPLPYFVIMDPTNEVLFRVEAISGPPDSKTYTFGIMPTDGDSLVGKIKQETGGTLKKILRENFITINYYINLDAKIKALILGACFLIDLIFFEMF